MKQAGGPLRVVGYSWSRFANCRVYLSGIAGSNQTEGGNRYKKGP